jgi:hypothetical protein
MRPYLWILILFIGIIQNLNGQVVITGTVTDANTGLPISSVNLVTGQEKMGTASDQNGKFSLRISRLPVTIRCSHIAYEPRLVNISRIPDKPIVIKLEPRVESIGEVVIEGGKYIQLLKRENFYVNDYEFNQDKIWVVGYAGKSILKPEVILLDQSGRIIRKEPIEGRTNLYQDAFGRVHLIDRGSMAELEYRDGLIRVGEPKLFNGWEQNLFDLQLVLGKSGIFKWQYNNGLYCEYAVVNFRDTSAVVVHTSYDRELFRGEAPAKNYRHPSIPDISMGSFGMGGSRTEPSFDPSDAFTANAQDRFFKYTPVTTHVFRYRNNILIFEDKGCHLWKYDLGFGDSVDMRIIVTDQARNADMLQDPVTGNLYLFYTILGKGYLAGIDPLSGSVQFTRKLENYYRIENLKVFNNRLWFTHQNTNGSALMNLYSTAITD